MKRASTLFLQVAIICVGVLALAFLAVGLYFLIREPINEEYDHIAYPIITGVYLLAFPFEFALCRAYNILTYVNRGTAFSELSVRALQHIKYCAFINGVILASLMPFFYLLAQMDDAPGIIVFASIPVFAAFGIGVFAAVLQMLLHEALEIKRENELTI